MIRKTTESHVQQVKIMTGQFLLLFIIFLSPVLYSQTYTGSGGLIPDDGNSVTFSINVTGLTPVNIDTIFGIQSVCINATHTWDSDLHIVLISPDGTQVVLTSGNGGDGDGYINTCFVDTAVTSVVQGTAPFSGDYRPQEDLGYFNNQQQGNGIWSLYILDTYAYADAGELFNWNITFGNHPAMPFIFKSSNLPIVVINTNHQEIIDEPKIPVHFGIIDNGPGIRNYLSDPFTFKGNVGIELRGSSSQSFPKKSYGLETIDTLGNVIDTSLFGMPSENDWILNAHYSDKTQMRNVLSYRLWENMGHYGSRTRFCELVINKKYQGIFVFMEKIKRDDNRVDISDLTPVDNFGDELTGGYIIKIDKTTGSGGDGWTSNYPPPVNPGGQTIFFQYHYPDQDDITPFQENYVQSYVDSFETALAGPNFSDTTIGFRKYASERSFIDYFILSEISKNVDAYRLSTYLHKNKRSNGGKLKIGPAWDYDIAWYNADYCGGNEVDGWAYQFPCDGDYWQVPFWWNRFLQDPLFRNKLKCRWEELRSGILSFASLNNFIDSVASLLDESKDRNFEVWPILGVWVWPNVETPATYQEEVDMLKNWLYLRITWLDANIPGNCIVSGNRQLAGEFLEIYPNPASDFLYIRFSDGGSKKGKLAFLNSLGEKISVQCVAENQQIIKTNVSNLSPGIYTVVFSSGDNSVIKKFIKIN
ncbi:MAG: CotH kinase family protein [Bacteroidota bacterium]